ncbi:AAA family ATPase [Paenarthrobacter sp. C1]|uniref:nucleotide-binding protein n=1 Tax=Paenarthrobacter sp. C1 TaxID=3400220 RepID=UPI003BF6154A
MNTSDSAVTTRGRIGLIELPALAETLTQCGLQVVTGPDFRAAATSIIAESKTAGAFPIIVADVPAPGLRAWVGHLQAKTPVKVAVVRGDGEAVAFPDTVAEIHLPTTVNAILASVGLAPLDGPEGLQSFPPAPAVDEPVGIELPGIDFFEEESVAPPAQAAVTVPVEEDPFAAPAPAAPAAPAFDDWESPASDAVETAPAAAPVPVQDEWDTPAAAPVSFEPVAAPVAAPAPVASPAAPAIVAPAPVQDEWDTPAAPAAVQAPEQPGSRRAARAAQQVQQQAWSAPAPSAAPAPAPAPAPVVMAAPPIVNDWDAPPHQPTVMAPPAEEFGDWDTPELPVVPVQVSEPVPAENYFGHGAPQAQQPFVQAPAGTPAWHGVQTPVAPTHDSTGIFDDFEASKLIGTGRSAAGLGAFVINYSGKGGVGKSTTSLQLAHVAAEAGLRVVLIDGNSGQGDLRTYLRLNRTNLPTMYDAAIGSIKDAILTPATINANREEHLGEIKFAFIGAPPDDINDPSVVTDALYRDVIHFARRNADLVIMDTQIVESSDRTGVVNMLLLPALVHDAWGIGVADMSTVGVNNLNNRLRKFINEGVPTSRLMVLINQVHPEQVEMAAKAVNYFRNLGTFLGAVEADINVKHDMNAGRINSNNPQLRAVMSKALLRITGNEAFREASEYRPEAVRKQGMFARLMGKRAA